MVLTGQQVCVHGAAIIQHLALHAHVRRIAFKGSAQPDSVVAVGEQLELEAEHKVAVLFYGKQIAAAIGRAVQNAVLRHITRPRPVHEGPAVESRAVKNPDKPAVVRAT